MNIKKGVKIFSLVVMVLLLALGCGRNAEKNKGSSYKKPSKNVETDAIIGNDETLARIYSGIKESYDDNYLPVTKNNQAMIEENYGISPLWYHAAVVETAAVNAQPDMLMGFLVKEEYKEQLLLKVTEYRTALLDNAPPDPVNAAKIQASQILVYDEHIFFIMLGIVDDAKQDAVILKDSFAKENQKAIKVIEQYLGE